MAKMVPINDSMAAAITEYAAREKTTEYAIIHAALEHYLKQFGGYRVVIRGSEIAVERSESK